MNIIVINPGNKPYTNKTIVAEPLDVLMIATIIEKKYPQVKVLDMDSNRLNNDINKYLEEKNIVIFVYDYQLPLHTSNAIENIFEVIKNTQKPTKFIIIGKTSTYYYQKFLDNGIDIIIKGIADDKVLPVIDNINCEEELSKIPNIIYKKDNKIIKTTSVPSKNLFSTMPIPNRKLVSMDNYMDTRTMITSRGCIGTCKFCTTPYFYGKWSGKPAEEIIKEIEMLIKEYHTKKIIFLDDNMIVDKERIMNLCREIKRKKIKCLFGCLCSIKCYDYEMLKEMYESGFRWVHFGIESGSERLLKLMHKDMDISYIKKVIKEVKELGYRVRTSFILDYPTTTKEDLQTTKDLILELNPHELRLHYLAYRVGTPIYNENKDISNGSQYIHSNKPNIKNNEITTEVNNIIESLQKDNYHLITEETDWNKYTDLPKNTKIAAFTPIKYGMCWYE